MSIKLLCGASKGFMKVFKTFIKLFETPQGIVKIKINVNFFTSSGFGTGMINSCKTNGLLIGSI